jgi:tetraacyldisaccharide 4'-kinase
VNPQNNFRFLLYPLAWFYCICVRIRNFLFDGNILSPTQFPISVISVGNLEAGGTGKTPMIEYLIDLLKDKYRIAVLSRGYKRTSSGYILADNNSTPQIIGDESHQIKSKYPDIIVAVDKNRCRGIRNLLEMEEKVRPQVILLDDAFQHRYVQPSLSILMTDYNRLYYNDRLLPVGRLREPSGGVRRANIVVTSKCDESLKPIDCRIIENDMRLLAYQSIFFSSISYLPLACVFADKCTPQTIESIRKDDEILLLTGIANPHPLVERLQKYSDRVKNIAFPDHHSYTKKDMQKIHAELARMKSDRPLMICTEKDAAKLRDNPHVPNEWKSHLYYIPITMNFLFGKGKLLNEQILYHIDLFENSSILRR